LGHAVGVLGGVHVEDPDKHQDDAHGCHTPEIDGATAEVGHECEPGDESADEGHASSTNAKPVYTESVLFF
jgi:hypothetical protein